MRKTSQKFSQSHMLCKVALVAIMLVFQAMLGIGAGVLNAQTVKGTVISGSDNEPLIGASVMVQGTKTWSSGHEPEVLYDDGFLCSIRFPAVS